MTGTTALLGVCLLAACGGERKDASVSTTTERGTAASPLAAGSEAPGTTQVRPAVLEPSGRISILIR